MRRAPTYEVKRDAVEGEWHATEMGDGYVATLHEPDHVTGDMVLTAYTARTGINVHQAFSIRLVCLLLHAMGWKLETPNGLRWEP